MENQILLTKLLEADSIPTSKLYVLIANELIEGVITSGDEQDEVQNWLTEKRNWLREKICNNQSIISESTNHQALLYAIAQAIMPSGGDVNYTLYAWIAVLIVRVGISKLCE